MSGRRPSTVGRLQMEPIPAHQEPLYSDADDDNSSDKQHQHQQSVVGLNRLIDIVVTVRRLLELCIGRKIVRLAARIGQVEPFRTELNWFIRARQGLPRQPKADILFGIEEIGRLHQVIQIDATKLEPCEEDGITEQHEGQRDREGKSPDLARSTGFLRHRLIHDNSRCANPRKDLPVAV